MATGHGTPIADRGQRPPAAPGALTALGLGHLHPRPGRLALPDVCCDLVWGRGGLSLSGPSTRARASQNVGGEVWLLRLAPLVARAWLRLPLEHLTDRSVPLADIAPHVARELQRLKEEGGLEALVRPAGDVTAAGVDPRLVAAVGALQRGKRVAHVAAMVALSERQMERTFRAELGMAPKTFSRIVRFRAALRAAASGVRMVDAAAAAGFADQAHFSHEARAFTGVSPRGLLPRVGNLQDIVAGAM